MNLNLTDGPLEKLKRAGGGGEEGLGVESQKKVHARKKGKKIKTTKNPATHSLLTFLMVHK